MRKPRPLTAKNPGRLAEPTPIMRGDTNRTPGIVHAAEGVAHEASHLAKVGATAAKSAGHAAHDALHRIGL